MTRSAIILTSLLLAACGRESVNAPTQPAEPVTAPEAEAAPAATSKGVSPSMPGAGPETFVGRWAARVSWCGNTTGPERPIELTTTQLRGYENVCTITSLNQVDGSYEASLACEGEGMTSNDRARFKTVGEELTVTWLSRDNAEVRFVRCAAPDAAQGMEKG